MKSLRATAPAALAATFLIACGAGDEHADDKTAPTCRISGPVDLAGSWRSSTDLTLMGTARDDQSGIEAIRVFRNGEAQDELMLEPVAGTTQDWKTEITLTPGDNQLVVQAVDAAGNVGDCTLDGSSAPAPWSVGVETEPPVVHIGQNAMYDERDLHITFDADARPCYGNFPEDPDQTCPSTPTPISNIGLNADSTPANTHIFKYVTRLDGTLHDEDNPIVWYLEAEDTGGSDVGIVQYKVNWPAAPGVPAGETAWLDATPPSLLNGTIYSAYVTKSALGADAAKLKIAGTWSIEFRAVDRAGNVSPTAAALWDHHPMAPPLQIRVVPLADSDPRSVQFYRLQPTTAVLAPGPMSKLIDGSFGPGEAAGIVRYEVRNGTDEDAYVQFLLPQNIGAYQGSTVLRNVKIGEGIGSTMCEGPDNSTPRQIFPTSVCPYTPAMPTETCFAGALPGCTGTVAESIANKVIVEDGPSAEAPNCTGCAPNEWMIGKRIGIPSAKKVLLAASDFSFLSPISATEMLQEISITPFGGSALTLTGLKDERYVTCRLFNTLDACMATAQMQRYRALKRAQVDASDLYLMLRARPDLASSPAYYYSDGAPLYSDDPAHPSTLRVPTFSYATAEPVIP